MGPAGQRLDVARGLKETLYVSSVQVLRLADGHGKSYIFSLRPRQFPATTLSLQRCQDDLHVLTNP